MGKYADLMIQTFESKIENGATTDGPIRFTSDDLRTAMGNLDHDFTRLSDAVYYYNFRHELPDELQEHGYKHVVSIGGEGQDGVYVFTEIPQQLDNTEEYHESILIEEDSLPDVVAEYISGDEQGSLSTVRRLDIMDEILGLECYHLQSHLRTEIQNQKMEMDEVYIGVDRDGERYGVIVEAKGTDEELNRSQLIRNTIGLRNSPDYPNNVITTGLKVDEEGVFYISKFYVGEIEDVTDIESEFEILNVDLEIEKTWRYLFSASLDDEIADETDKQVTIDEVVN